MFLGTDEIGQMWKVGHLLLRSETRYVLNSPQQIEINLEVLTWPGFRLYKISHLVMSLFVQTSYVKYLT